MLPLDAIATRTLDLRHPDGTTTPILVRIGRPEPIDDGANYRCEYEIEGLSTAKRAWFFGIDGVQALSLALAGVGMLLRTSPEGRNGRITFNGGADLFFPNLEAVVQPEWHVFEVDGDELQWAAYSSLHQTADKTWSRSWILHVARVPPYGVSTTYPEETVLGVEHARSLARLVKERGHSPF